MNQKKINLRLWIFLMVFILMNLAFVPLMALYGLRVCPVLHIAGFWFGCAYVGTYIFLVSFLNLIFVVLLGKYSVRLKIQENLLLIYAGIYFLATLLAMVVLQMMLKINHLSPVSRAPEILGFASLLLGMTQAYGLNWAFQNNKLHLPEKKNRPSFRKVWLLHSARTLLPILTALGLLIHFQISQSEGFNSGGVAAIVTHDQMIYQTTLVIAFLIFWLLITFSFYFLSEGQYASSVQEHLEKLTKMETSHRSLTAGVWNLWSTILFQLNDFSKALEERSRLLNSFSRFVSKDVAKQALKSELTHTVGITQDTTILISDIRNFTGLSEKLDPHQTVSLLNQYFTAMLNALVSFQINVDKFIGDGILAYVETNIRKEENSEEENELAVLAGLAMLAAVKELNLIFDSQKLPNIQIGIGIYRGPVIIGLIGSETKLQHTIIGDSVNRTARLESLCKSLGANLLISEEVWLSLKADLKKHFKPYGKHPVKGLNDLLSVYGNKEI